MTRPNLYSGRHGGGAMLAGIAYEHDMLAANNVAWRKIKQAARKRAERAVKRAEKKGT